MGVRVNCVVPDWIATERAVAELAGMSEEVRAATPAPIRMEEAADAVVACIGDDRMAGRVTCCGAESLAACWTRSTR